MNKKIKKILRDLELCNGFYDFIIEPDDSKLLIDYIKSLQRDNKNLKKKNSKSANDFQSKIRMPYVIIYYNRKTEIWPYVEAQEFCISDLSNSIIRLTDEEFDILESIIKSLQRKEID